MTDLIERIKADRAEGTQRPWVWSKDCLGDWFILGVIAAVETDGTPGGDKMDQANARRIARVPEMEQALIDQAAEIERLRAALTYKPTEQQKQSAALSYDHSFGLMNADDQSDLTWQAGEWLIAWQHEARVALQEDKTDG